MPLSGYRVADLEQSEQSDLLADVLHINDLNFSLLRGHFSVESIPPSEATNLSRFTHHSKEVFMVRLLPSKAEGAKDRLCSFHHALFQ